MDTPTERPTAGPIVDDGHGAISPLGVVVFGMHRSGTSAMTRVLIELGLSPGPTEHLLGASEANPYGHFEPAPLQEANERLLAHLQRYWHCPPTRTEVFALDDFDEVRYQTEHLMSSLFPRRGWVYKDPRLCIMWQLYRPMFEPQPAAVFVARHPAEVAVSLHTRDTIPVSYGLELWEFYNRVALCELADFAHVHVARHDGLLGDPDGTAAALVAFLDRAGIDHEAGLRQAAELVDTGLRRSAAAAAEVELDEDKLGLWEQMVELAEHGFAPVVSPPSERLDAAIDRRAEQVRDHIDALRQGWEQPVDQPHRPV